MLDDDDQLWHIELSKEVDGWLEALPVKAQAQAIRALDLLAVQGTALRMPHSRKLDEYLWELRFRCGRVNQRITYTVQPERRVITLTTFRKQRSTNARKSSGHATCYAAGKARSEPMTNYADRREQIMAELDPAEQAVFDEAYAAAGLAMELAETAYRAREVAGLTQAELARKMGTTQSAIAAIESGARTPTVELLERLARACGQRLTISIDAA